MACSPPGSALHGISQARILEWVAICFSGASSQPKDWTHVSGLAGGFYTRPPGQPPRLEEYSELPIVCTSGGGSEGWTTAEMGLPCRHGIDLSCPHLPLNCWLTAARRKACKSPGFLPTERRGPARRTASQEGCRFSGSRRRSEAAEAAVFPEAQAPWAWLSVVWFVSRMEWVGIPAPWKSGAKL